ncbi:hypothetical protein CYMTET_18692 [Cymbomonas tetramitiformis]|uniref:Uncharacterized protein n=1 Tax=Cymbomonas tetramitiformis TaxID=36881 RepID=A0AAE0L5N7_9CHLO|nr:hypothetical protein CYMTET_18692 [Cymbomonas tetramitiformis]
MFQTFGAAYCIRHGVQCAVLLLNFLAATNKGMGTSLSVLRYTGVDCEYLDESLLERGERCLTSLVVNHEGPVGFQGSK